MKLRLILAWWLGSALSVMACGGATDDDDDEFLDEAKFRERFPTQLCAQISSCCDRIGAPISEAACRASAQDAIDEPPQAAGVHYDGAAAAKCLNAYTAAFSHCGLPIDEDIDVCDSIYVGTVPEGGACIASDECANDGSCEPNASGALVCVNYNGVPAAHGAEGDSCWGTCEGDPSDPCAGPAPVPGSEPTPAYCYTAEGLHCDFATSTCTRLPALGEPCPNYYCVAGAYCDDLTVTCREELPEGAPCEYGSQCQAGDCGDGVCGNGQITAALCGEF
ncbi:MAG TPA: hypothetical protein VM686_33125 [Polyangiaceae bacterium]|nr:hypothetical protein [Polyangiaceae bacterium]